MKFTGLLMVCGMAGCLPLISAELLPNGTFEQRFREWHYPDYAGKPEPGEIVSDVVYGGKFAYRMGLSGDKDNFLYVSFKPVTGRDHQITLMWKADGLPPDDAEIQILRNGGGKVIGWASNPAGSGVNRLAVTGGTHDWRQVRFTISGKEFPPDAVAALGFSGIRVRTDGRSAKVQFTKSQIADARARADEIKDTVAPYFDDVTIDDKVRDD